MGPAARPGPGGSGYSLLPSHSVLPSCIVNAARYGGATVGDVRGRVARLQSGRLQPRRVWVSVPTARSVLWPRGVWRPRRGRRGRSTPPCRLVGDPGRLVAAGVELVWLKDPPGYVQPDALKSCLVNCYDHPMVIPPTGRQLARSINVNGRTMDPWLRSYGSQWHVQMGSQGKGVWLVKAGLRCVRGRWRHSRASLPC